MEVVAEENEELRAENFAANKQADFYELAYYGLSEALEKYGCGNTICKVKLMDIMAK